MAEPLERCERELRRLLGQIGTVDPASPAFGIALEDFRSGLPCEAGDRAQLERLLALNALVRDAVSREREGVSRQLEQLRAVRASLAQAAQPGATGDSCDVRG